MTQCCGKIPTPDDFGHMKESRYQQQQEYAEWLSRREMEAQYYQEGRYDEREDSEEEEAAYYANRVYAIAEESGSSGDSRDKPEKDSKEFSGKEEKDTSRSRVNPRGNSFQGGIGEMIAAQYASEELGLTAEFYDAPDANETGIDSVFRDGNGKLVLVEAKATDKSGKASLGNTKYGKEGSPEWVTHHAEVMCDKTSSKYTPDNAKIGEEILRLGAENVSFIVIHTGPKTLKTDYVKLR